MNLSGCQFESDLVTLEIPTAPPQPFSQDAQQGQAPQVEDLAQPQQPPDTTAFGALTSAEAKNLCEGREYYGDDNVGSCLAPGGDSYYVWIAPDQVLLIDRNDPYLQAFRFAALNRADKQGKVDELLAQWPELGLLFLEGYGAGVTCGGAIASGSTGVGLVVAAALATGCVGTLAAFLWTGVGIARDAQELVESAIAVGDLERDAQYNFCRMQGGSDAECGAEGLPTGRVGLIAQPRHCLWLCCADK